MASKAPHDPEKLPGTEWTATDPEERRKHWEVVEVSEEGEATLRAVIDGETKQLPWRELRDRDRWRPGWE